MIKMCEFIRECGVKHPSYNYPDQKKGIRCTKHAEEGMIDVKHKKCNYVFENGERCKKQPNFGLPNQKAIKCSEHSLPDMIDLKHKKCDFIFPNGERCKIRSRFGLINQKVIRCSEHALEDMVNITDKNVILLIKLLIKNV